MKTILAILALALTGCATTSTNQPPATDAPIAVVGNNFVNDAVEVLQDYKDFKSGNTGWLYTLEKGLHAYGSVTKSVADAKLALQPFVDSKGQPFLDRLMLLLKKKPDVPLETKMAALAQLSDHVAAGKGP
jgi:hypothetical protein